jgi:chromosome segregation ATPase
LKEELKKNYCTDSDDIGSKSLTSSSIETRNSFQLHGVLGLERSQLTTEYEELASIQSTEKDLRTKVSSLHHENKIIQEQKEGLQMELEMSHTMISEMEQRLMQFEASKANSTQQLMESLQDKDTELVDQKNRVSNLTNERVDLFERIDDLEKHLQDSQWTREELRKDLERAKMELIEAKDEVTCMHESVLHRLENGETRARAEAEINKIETEARKLTRELKASNEICEYLESSFRACRSTLLATFFQCESLKREKNSASHRVDQLKMRVLELSTSATEKETELDTKNGTLSLLDAKKVDLQESIKKLEMEFKSQDCGLDCPTKAQSSSAVLCLHTELFQEKLRQAQDELVETGLLREKLLSLHEEKASSEKTQSECISDPQIKQENDKLKTLLEFSRKAEVGYGVRIASLEAELSTTAEELARESLDLSRLKEVIDADQAFLFEAEEDLYQAVDIIKTLESNIATKKKAILTSKFRIDELIESEEVLAAENVCLYEKLLCLEGKVTSSSKLICDMRRSVASLESEKTALQTDLKNTGIESDEIDSVRSKLIEVSRGLKRAEIRAEQFEFTNMILESDMASLLDTMEKETSITHVEANRRERELKNNASLLRESLQEAIRKHLNVQETLREVKKRHDCEIETLEKSKSMVQSLLDEKQQQNDRLTMDFSAVVDEKNILRSTMVELEKSLTKKQVEFDDSLLSSQNQVETFKAKIGIIETERDSIQHKLTTVRSLVESKTKMQEKLEMDHQRHLADLQKNFLLLKAEYIAKHLKCIEFEKVVTDKDEDVLSLEIEISILQETLKEKGSEHRSEIAKFENRSNKMRIQAEKREEQIEKLLKVNYTASTELSDARRVLAERDASQAKNQSTFEEEKKMLLREKEQLTEQLFDLQRRNDQMKHILECLGKERETTQSKLQMAQKDFEHCLKDAQAKRCWSLAAAEALKRNLSKIDGEKKSLVNELEERALDNLKFVNVLQVANEMHQRNIVRLEFTNETLQSLADKRQEEIEKLAYEVSDASAEIDTLRESASSLDTLLRERQHSLETEKDRLNRDSSILREDLKSTNDQLLASKKEVGQLTQLLFNVETERDTLQCTLMAAQECAKVCDRKGRELAVEKANLEESIRRQHEELRQLREARCIGEAAREGLERAYNQLESQTDDLTANVKMKCTEIAFLSCNIDTVKSESKSFEKKVIFFKGLAHEKENENDKLREALEENREKHVEDSNDLKNNLEALTQKLLNAEEVIEQTNRSIQNINQERDSKHHDLELCRITLKQLIQEKSGFEASHRSQQEELRHARRGRCIEEAAREGLRRCCSCNTDNQRLLSCMEENTETANCGTETEEPHDDNSRIDGMGSFPGSNLNSLHLFSYKSAFQNQKEVLANVMASECLLTDFMKEVTNLGHGANAEIVELLRLLKYCEIPKREMLALDLASIQPSHEYIQGVCSRLDHLRQLAEEACSELGTRQRDFKKWQQARAQPPKTPITPRDLIKKESPGKDSIIDMVSLLNDRLLTPFEKNDFRLENCDSLRRSLATTLLHHNENTQRAKITGNNLGDGIARKLNLSIGTPNVEKGAIQTKENVRTKLAGARLLSSNLERRSMSQRASAFRKWSRASGAMKATSHQKEASVELSLQLENTRKKLVVLKSHLNLRKGRRQVSNSDKKPRLQMLLNAVTEQKRSSSDSFEV